MNILLYKDGDDSSDNYVIVTERTRPVWEEKGYRLPDSDDKKPEPASLPKEQAIPEQKSIPEKAEPEPVQAQVEPAAVEEPPKTASRRELPATASELLGMPVNDARPILSRVSLPILEQAYADERTGDNPRHSLLTLLSNEINRRQS